MSKVFKISALLLPVLLLCLAVPCRAVQEDSTRVRFIPMKYERLPDLNIPRAGHQVFVADGEPVVVGGHTEGFVRTATAEFFKDGEWHTLKTHYPHDYGFSLRLADGDYLIGGGCSEEFGVGRTFGVERYNPAEHSFSAFPVLDIKRTLCSAALLPSGKILVSGNWYAGDALGLSDGEHPFESVKASAQNRAVPFIFPFGKDDAVVFGSMDEHAEKVMPVIDLLHGEPYTSDLLKEWVPWTDNYQTARPDQMRATDPVTGEESYLFGGTNQEGEIAILRFCKGAFSKIDTDYDIPTEGPWGVIHWYTSVYTDNNHGIALIGGYDAGYRFYLLCLDYHLMFSGGASRIKVFYSSPDRNFSHAASVILQDGRFVAVGGTFYGAHPMGNYNPSAAVFAFSPFEEEDEAAGDGVWWIWVILLCALLALLGTFLLHCRKKAGRLEESNAEPQPTEAPESTESAERENLLYRKLCEVMEKEELYKQQGLSLADVASRMRTNTKYISSCISAGAGCSFVEFVNGYRIRAAQGMLLREPGLRLDEVSEAVGFANESTFYRNFKNVEGCTPQQWLERNKKG